jgi:ABC-2 type transport system permease protein
MSGVKAIFLKEMSEQVRSPRMWSLFGLFALISGFYFAVELMMQTAILALELSFLSSLLFVLIPLLTMKSYAGEREKRTDVLLLTAPVRTRSIVLGKFLSGCLQLVGMASLTLVHLLLILLLGGTIDKITWAAYLAFLLTGFVYLAIGQFISARMSSQTVAALTATVIFLLLNLLKTTADSIGLFLGRLIGWLDVFDWLPAGTPSAVGAHVTALIHELNPAAKLAPITEGILSLPDLVYLLSLIAFFLFLTETALERRHWARK